MLRKAMFIGVTAISLVGCSGGSDEDIEIDDVTDDVEATEAVEADHIEDFDVDFKDNDDFEESDVDLTDEVSEFKDKDESTEDGE